MCHEKVSGKELATHNAKFRNFGRDGSRPTVFDMQVLITNHFVLLGWKLTGSERQMKAFCKVGKVRDKEMNASESLKKHHYQ